MFGLIAGHEPRFRRCHMPAWCWNSDGGTIFHWYGKEGIANCRIPIPDRRSDCHSLGSQRSIHHWTPLALANCTCRRSPCCSLEDFASPIPAMPAMTAMSAITAILQPSACISQPATPPPFFQLLLQTKHLFHSTQASPRRDPGVTLG